MNQLPHDTDIPVLTDVISEDLVAEDLVAEDLVAEKLVTEDLDAAIVDDAAALQQLEDELSERLMAQLSSSIPLLLESGLREYLPEMAGARLQTAIMAAVQSANNELATQLAFEISNKLQQQLEVEVRRAVSEELARL